MCTKVIANTEITLKIVVTFMLMVNNNTLRYYPSEYFQRISLLELFVG